MSLKRRVSYETKEKLEKIGKVFMALTALMIIGGTMYGLDFVLFRAPKMTWHIKKAETCLSIASKSTDFNLMSEYITSAYGYIEHENGNIGWWYPTDMADWDILKSDMLKLKDRCSELAEVYTKGTEIPSGTYTQYEVLVKKITETDMSMITERLGHLSNLMTSKSKAAIVHTILWSFCVVILIVLTLLFTGEDSIIFVLCLLLLLCIAGFIAVAV